MSLDVGEPLQVFSASCNRCIHLVGKFTVPLPKCKAFPEGIPEEIVDAYNDHTQPFPGDHGIQFESKKDKTA